MTNNNWFDSVISTLVTSFESVFLKKVDIEDNLTTNNSAKVLSAKQGKWLNDNKSDKNHNHNSNYYTKSEIDDLIGDIEEDMLS